MNKDVKALSEQFEREDIIAAVGELRSKENGYLKNVENGGLKNDEDNTVDKTAFENEAPKGDGKSENEQKTNAQTSKFKNPDELFKAYRELEKEFTRRSQRLAQLENGAEIKEPNEDEWKQKVEEFFNQTPAAKPFAKDIAKELIAHPELKSRDGCLDAALTRVLVEKYRSPEQLLDDGEFLNKYVLNSPTVKKAVVASYLKDLKEGIPPVVLSDGGEIGVAPLSKPKTVQEAGALFYKQQK